MLTYEDEALIRNAIMKRLDAENGVKILDIGVHKRKKCIIVKIEAQIFGNLGAKSRFELPTSFEHAHLLDEIDQIAEQFKAAKKDYWLEGRPEVMAPRQLLGTGARGLWERYG